MKIKYYVLFLILIHKIHIMFDVECYLIIYFLFYKFIYQIYLNLNFFLYANFLITKRKSIKDHRQITKNQRNLIFFNNNSKSLTVEGYKN